MKYLGIDYGERNIGLAISEGSLARPYANIFWGEGKKGIEWVFLKIANIIEIEGVNVVVIGVSEGEMGKKIKNFRERLAEAVGRKIEFWDESLTSKRAVEMMVSGGMRKSKRQKMKHSVAAAVILEGYLESKSKKI